MCSFLRVGDVIVLNDGDVVYTKVQERFIFENMLYSQKLTHQEIKVGKKYYEKKNFIYPNPPELFVFQSGKFVVEKTSFDGGGSGMSLNDTYPNGHHVWVRRLLDGKYDPSGDGADFYQSGCFTAMLPNKQPVRRMQMTFI